MTCWNHARYEGTLLAGYKKGQREKHEIDHHNWVPGTMLVLEHAVLLPCHAITNCTMQPRSRHEMFVKVSVVKAPFRNRAGLRRYSLKVHVQDADTGCTQSQMSARSEGIASSCRLADGLLWEGE